MRRIQTRIILFLLLIAFVNAVGTIGYMVIEGWSFHDSLYMTVITLTTVGYREIHEMSPSGELFTIILILGGVGIFLYVLSSEVRILLEGELSEFFGRKRLERKISELKDHYIVCGFGRMGKIISENLNSIGFGVVVIEKDPDSLLENQDLLFVEGDATSDEILKKAGVERAKGLISALPTDAQNLFVVLSASELNRDLFIVARASEEGNERKMLKAGAKRVVSPYRTGANKIVTMVSKPAVMDFIEFTMRGSNIEIQLEEIKVSDDSKFVNQTLDETGIGRDLNVVIVAIKKPDGSMYFNPTSKSVIENGDTLIALGEVFKLRSLEEKASP